MFLSAMCSPLRFSGTAKRPFHHAYSSLADKGCDVHLLQVETESFTAFCSDDSGERPGVLAVFSLATLGHAQCQAVGGAVGSGGRSKGRSAQSIDATRRAS